MLRWAEPLWLFALLLPAALFLYELLFRKRWREGRERFASASLWQHLSPGRNDKLRRTKKILVLSGLTVLIIGLANPQIGTRYENVTREGIDIFLLVDVSKSMDTQDIRPSRLAKTRYELNRFLEGLKGDRIGIIPFAGAAYTLCPLTMDYSAASMFLGLLETDLIPSPGTAIAEALETAFTSFPEAEDRGRAIILVSDGEDHEGGVESIASEAGKIGIPIYSIGMALDKGDPIPEYDESGQPSGWKLDDEGHVVTSRLNESMLQQIAANSGGVYYRAGQGGNAFKAVYRKIFKLDRQEMTERQISGFEDRFQIFILIAFILLMIEFILPMGTKPKKSNKIIISSLLLIILCSGFPTQAKTPHGLVKEGNKQVIEGQLDSAFVKYLEARAEMDSTRPELLYNLGGIYARKNDALRADSLYRSLPEESSKELKSRAAYNRGTAFAQGQQYDQAVQSFIESLKLDPNDMDAKTNLELALRMMQQQQKQKQQEQQQDNNDQNEKNEDQQDNKQQDQQQPPEENQEEQQPQPQEQEDMDKELAERFLDKLERDEKELLKEVIRQQIPAERKKAKKDW
ncbi:MAG: VWA domain-containing protein [Candidatus Electryonea clarkiae]|nr:VWA domain-containing protein [Candidatus Electryonea clarkiae]MDP8287504.1 VWA domain-containing protein [Candidatus Electryonea clarkiae]